jgi:hypothetical protein
MFYLAMRDWLLAYGFKQCEQDECLFTLYIDGQHIFIGIHVDDMLLVATSMVILTPFKHALAKRWNTTSNTGDDLNYVGLHVIIDRVNKRALVDMRGSLDKIITSFGQNLSPATTPAVTSILQQSGTLLTGKDLDKFHSLVMTLLYSARLCYVQVLFPVVLLATRMAKPTNDDLTHAFRIVRYLMTQRDTTLHLFCKPGPLQLEVYIDASHGIHADGRGHYCLAATLGGAPIALKSAKLEFVTTSSTESEMTAISNSVTYILWLRRILKQLGHLQSTPTVIYHDNLSAIQILTSGNTTWKRTKHIFLRFAFIMDHLQQGNIRFAYCPTKQMVADIGTKVHTNASLRNLLTQMFITC